MYGPPTDPHELPVPAGLLDQPLAWAVCAVVGLGLCGWGWRLSSWGRALALIVGLTTLLTAPALGLLPTAVWGAFPTIDKAGSLMFYEDGVQWRILDPSDPALQLIGVHVGHLWLCALLDLVLDPFAAMNAQSFLNLALSWFAAAVLLGTVAGDRRTGVLLGLGFGLGLHQLRDIQWYTVEKTALYPLPLYAWALWRIREGLRGWGVALPAAFCVTAFLLNVYVGLLCVIVGVAAFGAGAWARRRRIAWGAPMLGAVVGSAAAVLPLVLLQATLTRNNTVLPGPEVFLSERAALDVVSLWPAAWNRLELWRALDVVGVVSGLWGLGRLRRDGLARFIAGVGLVCAVLALGPLDNPVYRAAFEVVPGFWRVAKPETFFHLAWLCWLGVGARAWSASGAAWTDRTWPPLFAVALIGWLALVRTHPVYPGFSEPREVKLPAGWVEGMRSGR